MESKFAQQLKKGVLEMLVLQCLAQRPSHGYALLVSLRRASGRVLTLKEGTLYPILYRLEDGGYIAASWQHPAEPETGVPAIRQVPKKVYTITEAGRALLAEEVEIWSRFADCIARLLVEETKGEGQ